MAFSYGKRMLTAALNTRNTEIGNDTSLNKSLQEGVDALLNNNQNVSKGILTETIPAKTKDTGENDLNSSGNYVNALIENLRNAGEESMRFLGLDESSNSGQEIALANEPVQLDTNPGGSGLTGGYQSDNSTEFEESHNEKTDPSYSIDPDMEYSSSDDASIEEPLSTEQFEVSKLPSNTDDASPKEHAPKKAKKGMANRTAWKRNRNQTLRMQGEQYVGFKKNEDGKYKQDFKRQKKSMGQRCN